MNRRVPPSASGRRGSRLGYLAQQRLSLLLVALVPLAAFAAVALSRIQGTIMSDADTRAQAALGSVGVVLERTEATLSATTDSYATWDVLRDQVAALQTDRITSEVIDFQLDSGGVDAAVLRIGPDRLMGGSAPLSAALDAEVGRRLSVVPPADGQAGLARLGDGVYAVAVRPIDLTGRRGPGVTASATSGAWLAFAQRLGPRFVLDARRLTGFDVAVYGARGELLVATDTAAAQDLRPLGPPAATIEPAGPVTEREVGGLAAVTPLRGPEGVFLGTLAVTSGLGVLGTLETSLLPVLLLAFGLAAVLALALAVFLAERLRQGLRTVQAGISVAAAGGRATLVPLEGRDELADLAASHNRLTIALARRERIAAATEAAVARLTPDLGPATVRAGGLTAAREIFELEAAELVEDEAISAPEPPSPTGASGEVHEAPGGAAADPVAVRCPIAERTAWLVVQPAGATWNGADHAQLAAFGRLLGAAIDGAERFTAAAERAADHAAELDRLTRLQADFLRGVGHNLQTPLTRILAVAEELGEGAELTEPVRHSVEVVRAEARRLARLVGQLLTFSRLEAGAYRPEEELCAIAPLARRAWASLDEPRRLSIADHSGAALALADRAAVEQILWILLDNASRYAPQGPVALGLTLPAPGRLAVRVIDHGPGVPPEDRERIFERFMRGASASAHEGTGLGLGVARGVAEALGGSLGLEATPGGGATFVLTLPAEVPMAEP